MTGLFRAAISSLAVFVAICGFENAASAKSVTAPTGGLKPYQANLLVKWNGIAGGNAGTNVNVLLGIGLNGALIGIVNYANNVPNNGSHSLAAGPCYDLPPGYAYYATVYAASNMADNATSAPFRFVCASKPGAKKMARRVFDTSKLKPFKGKLHLGPDNKGNTKSSAGIGWLHIIKGLYWDTLGITAPTQFSMHVSCTNGLNQNVWAVLGGFSATINNLPTGTQCTVTEVPLTVNNVPGCGGGIAHWEAITLLPTTVTIPLSTSTVVVFTNRLVCGAPDGWIQVNKVVVNQTGGTFIMPASFPLSATCSRPGSPAHSVSIPIGVGVLFSFATNVGESCAVSEAPLAPVAAKGCESGTASWAVTKSPAVTVSGSQMKYLTVTNTLKCDPPKPKPGAVRVIKSIVNATGGSVTLPTSFGMKLTCTPGSPTNQAISVAPGGTGTLITNLVAGKHCSVTENPLAPIPGAKGCRDKPAYWEAIVSPSGPVTVPANGVVTITVRNKLSCDKPSGGGGGDGHTGTLNVRKRIVNESSIRPPDVPFYVDVDCEPNGPHKTVKLTAGDPLAAVNGIPLGRVCSITEQPAEVPTSLARKGCHWDTSYPSDERMRIRKPKDNVMTVVNRWICDDKKPKDDDGPVGPRRNRSLPDDEGPIGPTKRSVPKMPNMPSDYDSDSNRRGSGESERGGKSREPVNGIGGYGGGR